MFTSADLPLCGIVFLPLNKSLGPPHTVSLQPSRASSRQMWTLSRSLFATSFTSCSCLDTFISIYVSGFRECVWLSEFIHVSGEKTTLQNHLQTDKYRKPKKVIGKLNYNPADFILNAFGFLMSHMLLVKLESIIILKSGSIESTG